MWRSVKHAYRKKLFRREHDLADGWEHKAFIQEVLDDVKQRLDMSETVHANGKYIHQLLSAGV